MFSFLPSSDARLLQPRYRAMLLVLLFSVATLNFADRAVLSATIEPIRQELGLTDVHAGLLQGISFALLYSLLGLPIGRLAERKSRVAIIAVSTAAFSVMTLLCGAATSFLALFLCRVGVGVGEAGFIAPTSSLLGDHYPRSRRASAFSIVMLGSPAGFLLGAILGGLIAQHYGWRWSFAAMGIPGLITSVLLVRLLVEPSRGLADGAAPSVDPAPPMASTISALLAKPAYRHVVAGGALATFGVFAIGQFSFPFYLRAFHLSLAQTGIVSGFTTAISLSLGTLIGGFGVDRGNASDVRWNAWLPALGLFFGAIFYTFGFLADELPVAIGGLLLGGLALFFYYAPTYAMAQNMAPPRGRATAAALPAMVFGLVGAGLGPTFAGFASDRFADAAFVGYFHASCPGGKPVADAAQSLVQACAAASATGIRYALACMAIPFIWGAVHFLLASRTLRQDLYQPSEELSPEFRTSLELGKDRV